MSSPTLEELLYSAVNALILRETVCNDVREYHPVEKEQAIEAIVKELLILFEE